MVKTRKKTMPGLQEQPRLESNFFCWNLKFINLTTPDRAAYSCECAMKADLNIIASSILKEYKKHTIGRSVSTDIDRLHRGFVNEKDLLKKIENGYNLLDFLHSYDARISKKMLDEATYLVEDKSINLSDGSAKHLSGFNTKFKEDTVKKLKYGQTSFKEHHRKIIARYLLVPYFDKHPGEYVQYIKELKTDICFKDFKTGTAIRTTTADAHAIIKEVERYEKLVAFNPNALVDRDSFCSLIIALFNILANISQRYELNTSHEQMQLLQGVTRFCKSLPLYNSIEQFASIDTTNIPSSYPSDLIEYVEKQITASFNYAKQVMAEHFDNYDFTWEDYSKLNGTIAYETWLFYKKIYIDEKTNAILGNNTLYLPEDDMPSNERFSILTKETFLKEMSMIHQAVGSGIGAGVYIDPDAQIEPKVFIESDCWIGKNTIIKNGSYLSHIMIGEGWEFQGFLKGNKDSTIERFDASKSHRDSSYP